MSFGKVQKSNMYRRAAEQRKQNNKLGWKNELLKKKILPILHCKKWIRNVLPK